jgi:hypothetical protein
MAHALSSQFAPPNIKAVLKTSTHIPAQKQGLYAKLTADASTP